MAKSFRQAQLGWKVGSTRIKINDRAIFHFLAILKTSIITRINYSLRVLFRLHKSLPKQHFLDLG